MASQDEELDFTSGRFNPARALSSENVQLPDPEAPQFEDLYKLRETVHGQSFNVERELPGVSDWWWWWWWFVYVGSGQVWQG